MEIATLNIPISEGEKLVKVVLIPLRYGISATNRSRKHCSSQHMELFTSKHVARTNHKHALISLNSMINGHVFVNLV